MIFQITRQDKLKYLVRPLLIGIIIDFIIAIAGTIYYKGDFVFALKILLAIFIGQSILYYVPILIFYINYFRKDKKSILSFDTNSRIFEFKNESVVLKFGDDEIEKAIVYLSKPLFDKRPILLYWHSFHYVKIITNENNLIITCLVCDTLEDFLPENKIEKNWFHIAHAIPR